MSIEEAKRRVDECLEDEGYSLYLSGLGLTSLDGLGLEGLVNLKELYLNNNKIVDISFLKCLTKLEMLYLNINQIQDISALEGLTNLKGLYLNNNQIVDISPLKGLTKLKGLYLNNNQIVDISFLKCLTKLEMLYLNINQIKSIGCLPSSVNPEVFKYANNPLEDGVYHGYESSDIRPSIPPMPPCKPAKKEVAEFVDLKVGGRTVVFFRVSAFEGFFLSSGNGGRQVLEVVLKSKTMSYSNYQTVIKEVVVDLKKQLGK